MNKSLTITHMTSVHTRYDTRIFVKECSSLALIDGYTVNLIVADGKGDEIKNNVTICDVGKPHTRLSRILLTTRKVLNKALEHNSDIYHFHDPELIPIGRRLVKMGKKVIFDIHEHISKQLLEKRYLPTPARLILSKFYMLYEKRAIKDFTIILAENSYADYYNTVKGMYFVVLNMPQMQFFEKYIVAERKNVEFFYIGGISEDRGVYLIMDALKILNARNIKFKMHFIGPTYNKKINMENYISIAHDIIFHGRLELEDGFEISKTCMIGLSILKPIENYINSYSTKIFEYMAIKLPVITSNFTLYKNIVEKFNCGICVNPLAPDDIANAMQHIIENPEVARLMGDNGRNAIEKDYNWDIQRKRLIGAYKHV